jgi:hypothetical protein
MEYFSTVIGVAVVCSLCTVISPDAEVSYVKLIGGLCILCVLISPLSSFIGDAVNYIEDESFFEEMYGDVYVFENVEDIFDRALADASKSEIERCLESMLCHTFEIREQEIEVYVSLEESSVSDVSVVLSGKAVFTDPHGIIEYIEETLACRCEIVYS